MEIPIKPVEKLGGDINTLVELPITYTTGINYYYPYFHKSKLISFTDDYKNMDVQTRINDNNDKNSTSPSCEENCYICDAKNSAKCYKCDTGYFLNDDKCVDYCPEGKIADILRLKCLKESSNIDIVYNMAYSIGSCLNMCGKMVQDCSCAPSCKRRGNCCTDYELANCDSKMEKSLAIKDNCKSIKGCELCQNKDTTKDVNKDNTKDVNKDNTKDVNKDKDINKNNNDTITIKCNQCGDGYYLFDGKCLDTCPAELTPNTINRICGKNKSIIFI